jgi:biopolymer transport protein ExbB
MSFDLLHIWSAMGPLSKLIALSLILMGIASAGVFVERTWSLSRSAGTSRHLARAIAVPLEEGDLESVLALCRRHRGSAMARLFGATIERYQRAIARGDTPLDAVEVARAEAQRRREAISTELRSGMPVVATVGSIAPFVGLLGTVVGIIAAFQGIAATGSGGLGAVSVGIAEALVETALGLLIAIPAVIFFNLLTQRVSKIEQALGRNVGELLDELGRRATGRRPVEVFDEETVIVGRRAGSAQPALATA